MKDKIRYTDEPMNIGPVVPNFLPPPDRLVLKEDSVKVTISLSAKSVFFFKTEAAKRGVQYQRMIRRLLDAYVEAFEAPAEATSAAANHHRAGQSRPRYGKAAKHR